MNLIERAYAQFVPVTPGGTTTVEGIITQIVNVMLLIAAALAVIYLIYSGILYITAAGNPDSAKKGQQGIINAAIGIAVILLVYVIIQAIISTVGTMFR